MKKINAGFYLLLIKIWMKLLPYVKVLKLGQVWLIWASVAAYTWLYTWQFAIALVIMLFIHEYGHVWAMKKSWMKVKGMYLIPFLGAVAVPDEDFPNRKSESYVAMMGPIFWWAVSFLFFFIYLITNNTYFWAVAWFMALINVFNLIPMMPLDWWRVIRSVIFSMNSRFPKILLFLLFIVWIIASFYYGIYLLGIFWIIWLIETGFDLFVVKQEIQKMNLKEVIFSLLSYFVVMFSLLYLMVVLNHIEEVKLAQKLLTNN